jgi:hypothetical protein
VSQAATLTTPGSPAGTCGAPSDPPPAWTPLSALASRFAANVAALAPRDADLAAALNSFRPTAQHFITAIGGTVRIGTRTAGEPIQLRPQTFPPARAVEATRALFPTGACTVPALIAGEDLGWLWDRLYRLPCKSTQHIGYRPPLYFLLPDLERLWVMLHVHDWRGLLADGRVRLFAGHDALGRFTRCLAEEWTYQAPMQWITVDDDAWPAGVTLDTVMADAAVRRGRALTDAGAYSTPAEAAAVAARLAAGTGRPLRILGITCRFSSFIQHSMRDWLAAFEEVGHQTRLLIEPSDHERNDLMVTAHACADFRPDLVVAIGHHRWTIPGIPPHVPVAMWVQDVVPQVFRDEAGAAQGPLDFCLGFGRLLLSTRHGYPADRFLPATVGVNVRRFAPGPLTAAERAAFECDVSYVSHNSTPADVVFAQALETISSPDVRRLYRDLYDRLVGHYATVGSAVHAPSVRLMLHASMAATGVDDAGAPEADVVYLFNERLGNAIFRHQSLTWAADLGVDLRIYGRGWENHPTLGRFARGIADNATQLSAIHRASRINLQLIVTGAMHQRMLDGLATGGFFLARRTPIDLVGRHYLTLWDWCQRNGITNETDFRRRADPTIRQVFRTLDAILGYEVAAQTVPLFDTLQTCADAQFTNTASAFWPDHYDRVSFGTAAELRSLVERYLPDAESRRSIAAAMREPVVERASYRRINGRLLDLIAHHLRNSVAA